VSDRALGVASASARQRAHHREVGAGTGGELSGSHEQQLLRLIGVDAGDAPGAGTLGGSQ
jgi:hypothetical protein